MCRGSQASDLSGCSVVKDNVCFPGYSELGIGTLTDLTKPLLLIFALFKNLWSVVCKVFSEI